MTTNHGRRKLLRVGGAVLVLIPLATITRQARGTTNSEKRTELKYQVTPLNGNSCVSCLEFIPGKTDHDFGRYLAMTRFRLLAIAFFGIRCSRYRTRQGI